MRILYKQKIIFLSNPKTGSTSVRALLDSISDVRSSGDKNSPYFHHNNALTLKTHFDNIGMNWSDYTVITTIRNPWAKAVSNFTYARPDQDFLHFYENGYNEITAGTADFKAWLKYRCSLEKFPGLLDLKEFCCDQNGNNLVDFILPIETIDRTLPVILRGKGITVNGPIPVINASEHKPCRSFYDDESRALIERYFADDIVVGRYTF